ncbi:MAG TPA: hypothetical protein VFT27_13305, partial [Actinomycetota bacterium]|nr:hypothetical protein [Actinomycetota bacterium]
MATSTLRAAIVIALVVGGIVVINSAFPESGVGGASPSGTPPTTGPTGGTGGPTGGTGGPTGGTGGTGATGQVPDVVDLPVAVRNGTAETGLAGDTARKMEDKLGVN